MRYLPSRGRCHAAFLLAHSARLKPPATLDAWIATTRERTTFMAGAADIPGTAGMLIAAKLARVGDSVVLDDRLSRVSEQADRRSLVAIARLWLSRFPPGWISTAVVDGEFLPEYVPDPDLQEMDWLGPDLPSIVLLVHRAITTASDEKLRKQLGDVGELAVVSALEEVGIVADHLALISDAFGYDIEYRCDGTLHRLEVKACFPSTAGRVIVSRNEYDKASAFASSWRLIQVCVAPQVVANRLATSVDILGMRELSSSALVSMAPPASGGFDWLEAAEFRPPENLWGDAGLRVAPDFRVEFGK